ncbi:Sugar kinase of the NBD/HSP70 family, may contain an N-terminal HTH domain [Draconibacterium orientale]|uniref:ROK family transcriptional regulator n=1 Tax=Draconibacterium orientale TaxID=1168034 RepID=X5DCN7_9BACT|nr:ROK family protein [Draconibacterium orientale]AHW60603.1 ROK family transcriptional regulator [Draconibacterium orientale]SET04899.1 Sugar kinase of the NBD/HSP70 family, may contain an N-terminal HTH domain [Draconibacterium orientale]
MKKTKTYLALDFGGTKLLIGELDDSGSVLNYKRYDTGYVDQVQALQIIQDSIDDYISSIGWSTGKAPVAMGMGLIGRIDNANGIWFQMDPKRSQRTELAKILSEKYDLPCYIDNDVKTASKGEKWVGKGAGVDNFIYLNVGTGIAASVVVNGQIVRGGNNNSGEVGHTSVGVNTGIKCGCGRTDCVELITAGIGFDRQARMNKDQFSSALTISEEKPVDVSEVYTLAKNGDKLCIHLVEQASTALANLIMNLVRVSDPELVVLGGGIVSDNYFFQKVQDKLNPTTIRFVTQGIVLTGLDPRFAGLIGAGAVAKNSF